MPVPNQESDKFVEVEGAKFKEDPEAPGEALKGEDGKPVPFEEAAPAAPAEPGTPKKRRSVQDHIISRQQRKIAKDKEKAEGAGGGGGDDEDELTPESKRAIKKGIKEGIAKEMDPIKEGIQKSAKNRAEQSDEEELKEGLKNHPEAKDMEKTIKSYMEAYPNAPVEFIIDSLLGRKAELERKKAEADKEENKNNLGGTSRRSTKAPGKIPDAKDMTPEEWAKFDRDVQQGKYLDPKIVR